MNDDESRLLVSRTRRSAPSHRRKKAALVTPCLPHLPLHPSCILGYGAAVLGQSHDLEVIDLNARMHMKLPDKLSPILDVMDKARIVSDEFHLYPFYQQADAGVDELYAQISWQDFSQVYVTPPTWFPTVPTESILRLSRAVRQVSSETTLCFFGNSLGSWSDEGELIRNGVYVRHLNDLHATEPVIEPVRYDSLPTPVYEHRETYLLELLPFMLKHGCPWGRCRFCSFCSGWNTGHLERSPKKAIAELEILIDRYNPRGFVCRDHSFNGRNLLDFCDRFESFS